MDHIHHLITLSMFIFCWTTLTELMQYVVVRKGTGTGTSTLHRVRNITECSPVQVMTQVFL